MSTKEAQEMIASNMRRWQKIENTSVFQTAQIMEKTDNPLIRLVMEVIQRDSQMHHRVQELIADSLDTKVMTLTPDDVAEVWGMIEKHIEMEKATVELANASMAAIEGKKGMTVQAYLLQYLLDDEEKHDRMLERLEEVKKGLYPYG